MSLLQEFKGFALKGNVIDLAVAVVMGGAFGRIVTAVVNDLVMPLVGAVLPSGEWRKFTVTSLHLPVGDLLGALLDFTIVALALFLLVGKFLGLARKSRPEATPTTRPCPECLETIPREARRCRACASVVGAVATASLLLVFAAPASAQEPKFEFGKPEAVKTVEWKAQAKAGLVLTTGNSQTATVSAGVLLSRKEEANKLSFDAGLAYARSSILLAADANGNGVIDAAEFSRQEQTTANQWFAKLRYDRFFTPRDSAYVFAHFAGDAVAGKDLVAGAQIGYSRQLYKSEHHELLGELGYDFSFEQYSASPDGVAIHSIRIFAGDISKINAATSVFANVEALFNVNGESQALRPDGAGGAAKGVDAFDDTRVNAKAGLSTTLFTNVSLSISYAVRYDHAPAPLPAFKLAPFAMGFVPFAETVDTLTEAALVINFQ